MKIAVKWVIIILLVILGLLLAWVIFNQFDAAAPEDEFKISDLRPAYFEKDNGFYILFGMREPPELDITSDEFRLSIRHLFDPAFDNTRYINEYGSADKDPGKWLGKWKTRKYPKDGDEFTRNRWAAFYRTNRDEYERIKETWKVLLSRYDLLMNAPRFEDFTLPRLDAPIPNLLLLLWAARVYAANHLLEALDGKWREGVLALIHQVDLSKRIMAGSRTLILNLIGKAMARISLQSIISIMNEKDCPAEVFSLVLEKLTPISYQEFGTRTPFIGEYLSLTTVMEHKDIGMKILNQESRKPWYSPFAYLMLQKNRTKHKMLDLCRYLIRLDQEEPCRWQKEDFNTDPPARKPFWWLQNPIGNLILPIGMPNLKVSIYKAYRLKVLHDLTRIIADLNLNYTPEKPVADILRALPTYSKVSDPFTGQPYHYNGQKQILYSVGWDRVDDGGIEDPGRMVKTDICAPCIPYYRPAVLKKK